MQFSVVLGGNSFAAASLENMVKIPPRTQSGKLWKFRKTDSSPYDTSSAATTTTTTTMVIYALPRVEIAGGKSRTNKHPVEFLARLGVWAG